MSKCWILIIGFILVLACKEESPVPKPEQLMNEQVYLDLFYELELLRIYQNRGIGSQTIDSLYDQIFEKYNADTALFRVTHEYFQAQILKQQQRVDTVTAKLEQEIQMFNKLDSLESQLP